MEGPVIDIRFAHQHGDARRIDGGIGENGEFLEYDAQLGVFRQERRQVGQGVAAIAAIVVEELHQRDVAIRIAQHHLARIVEDGVLHRGDGGGGLLALLGLQGRVQRHRHALQYLGIAHQIGFDQRVELSRVDPGDLHRRGCLGFGEALGVILGQGLVDQGRDGRRIGLRGGLVQHRIAQRSRQNARKGDKTDSDA